MNEIRLKSRYLPIASILGLALLAAVFPCTQFAQSPGDDSARKQFTGTWKATCQDGTPFVVLSIQMNGHELGGNISIANMNGANGQCVAVLDPPSPEHAMKISDAKVEGKKLIFQGSAKAHFEMLLGSSTSASLKFFGTPAENSPWQLTRSAETSQ